MPVRFAGLNARKENIPALVKTLGLGSRTLGSFVKLTENDVSEIYKLAIKGVIIDFFYCYSEQIIELTILKYHNVP
jgi:ribosomal protein L30/L7E